MSLSGRQRACLDAIGISRWVRRELPVADEAPAPAHQTRPEVESPAPEPEAELCPVEQMDWPRLESTIRACTACGLHAGRHHAVVGTGDRQASWLIVGEAPGEQEDLQGEPFVGRAGVLLNNMLVAAGLTRERVYIANVIKCRPPGNRDPQTEEVSACLHYLERQIALIEPDLILIVGRVAAQTLLATDAPVGRMRGRVHYYGSRRIPVVVTYHPAYLLRRPIEKAKSWADLKLALAQQR